MAAVLHKLQAAATPHTHGSRRTRRHGEQVDAPVLLARWRSREIALATQFRACAGASATEIEDVYDDTVTALAQRTRSYQSPEHLRRALHRGIKLRALRLHRDRARHRRVLEREAPAIDREGRERDWRTQPERALIAREDDILIGEFIAELTIPERHVFALVADGRSWRAIATTLELPEPQARALTRACERKRERFLAFYETGRLCGYRSHTIGLLLADRDTGELAFAQALAHLRHCHACQAQHGTNAEGLQARFDQRVAVFLPTPLLATGHWTAIEHVWATLERTWRGAQRWWTPQAGARERVAEIAAGSGSVGVGAKLAAGIASVALLAGGAAGVIGAAPHGHAHRARTQAVVAPGPGTADTARARPQTAPRPATHRARSSRQLPRAFEQRTPGGFSYLGAPPHPAAAPAVKQIGGGPFSP